MKAAVTVKLGKRRFAKRWSIKRSSLLLMIALTNHNR